MRTTSRIVTCTLLALLLTSACDSPAPQSASAEHSVIAEFGNEKVTLKQFYLYLKQLNPLLQYGQLPASEQQRLLDDYVTQRIYAAAAREEGLERQDEIAARMDFFEQRVLAGAFREYFAGDIDVSDSDAEAYYETNKALFAVPAQYLIEHLVYREPDKAIYAQNQLREGRPYLELAKHRESDTDLTFVERNRFGADILLPELRGPVSELAAGEVTELIYTNYGYHVIRLIEKDDGTFKPFEDVHSEIIARLQQARAGQDLRSVVEEELRNGEVKIHLLDLRSAGAL